MSGRSYGMIDGVRAALKARHHLVVCAEDFDVRGLRAWLLARVNEVEADIWSEIGERLGRVGYWEFEDYRA